MRRILILLVLIAVVAVLTWRWTRPEPVPVLVHVIETGSVEATVANTRAGTVEACRRAKLSPATGGQIETLPIKEGDHVEAGALLLELWNDDLTAQVQLAEQQLAAARARVDEACARAAVAENDRARLQRLYRQKLVSQGDVDRADGEAKASQAGCVATRANVGVSTAQVEVARAALARTLLHAPFAGTVAEINGELFEFVTPSPIGVATPPAVDLIDDSCAYVSAPIDEVDAAAIAAGQTARISLDAFPGRTFAASVRRVAPYVLDIEKQSRTVNIEADFAAQGLDVRLLPGYSADVEVLLDSVDDVLRVPTAAVLEGPKVLLLDDVDGRIVARDIKTGLKNWRWTEVREGLAAGDRVVTSVDRDGVEDGAHAVAETGQP